MDDNCLVIEAPELATCPCGRFQQVLVNTDPEAEVSLRLPADLPTMVPDSDTMPCDRARFARIRAWLS